MSEKEKLPWGLTHAQIAPGSIKALSRDKLEAFDQGTFKNKSKLSRKEQNELRKKEEEEAAKEVLQDFCESFENSNKTKALMFVKGATVNPKDEKAAGNEKGSLYKPALKLIGKSATPTSSPLATNKMNLAKRNEANDLLNSSLNSAQSELQLKAKKKTQEKKKSNLELFKEELKKIQIERDERHKKKVNKDDTSEIETEIKPETELNLDHDSSQDSGGRHKDVSDEDPNTTNIFVSNLSPKTNEQELMQRFGYYGLLASVKVMWPRSDEEKARNTNCGFVAFMIRRDAEKALHELDGLSVNGHTLRLSWSKSITLPLQPVYIPPELVEVTIPPPPSGLPFNAQPQDSKKLRLIRKQIRMQKKRSRSNSDSSGTDSSRSSSVSSTSSEEAPDEFGRTLQNALVKVVIPTDRNLLCLIHRTIEFVVREGSAFEAMIMAREINNLQFRFLFENQSPAHSYYRWKLYSILHGESISKWQTKPFRMFKNGSYWQPPPLNRYTQGSADESYNKAKKELQVKKKDGNNLAVDKRDKLEEVLRSITTERKSISEAMIFCIENAEKAEEIVECVFESLIIAETPLNKKVARLYLISDILHNCCAKVANASYYRRGFERCLPEIFEHNSDVWKKIDGKMKSESFKHKIIGCVRAWEDWAIYPNDYLVRLQNMFLGLMKNKEIIGINSEKINDDNKTDSDNDNNSESDLDGKPIEDLDGKPIVEIHKKQEIKVSSKFVSSKWETVDQETVEKQAITTSKWDFFDEAQTENKMNLTSYNDDDSNVSEDIDGEPMSDDIDGKPMENDKNDKDNDDDIDGKPMNEESVTKKSWLDESLMSDEDKRKMLREIEVQVLKFIDDLENGKIENSQMNQEVYRESLLEQAKIKYTSTTTSNVKNDNNESNGKKTRSRSSSSSSNESKSKRVDKKENKKRRSRSPKGDKSKKSRSRSPYNKNRSYYNSSSQYSSSSSSSRKKYRN